MNKTVKTVINDIDAFVCRKKDSNVKLVVLGKKGMIKYLNENTPDNIEDILVWADKHNCSVSFDTAKMSRGDLLKYIFSKETRSLFKKSGFYIPREGLEFFVMLKSEEIFNRQSEEFKKGFNAVIDMFTTEDDEQEFKEFLYAYIGNAAL